MLPWKSLKLRSSNFASTLAWKMKIHRSITQSWALSIQADEFYITHMYAQACKSFKTYSPLQKAPKIQIVESRSEGERALRTGSSRWRPEPNGTRPAGGAGRLGIGINSEGFTSAINEKWALRHRFREKCSATTAASDINVSVYVNSTSYVCLGTLFN